MLLRWILRLRCLSSKITSDTAEPHNEYPSRGGRATQLFQCSLLSPNFSSRPGWFWEQGATPSDGGLKETGWPDPSSSKLQPYLKRDQTWFFLSLKIIISSGRGFPKEFLWRSFRRRTVRILISFSVFGWKEKDYQYPTKVVCCIAKWIWSETVILNLETQIGR